VGAVVGTASDGKTPRSMSTTVGVAVAIKRDGTMVETGANTGDSSLCSMVLEVGVRLGVEVADAGTDGLLLFNSAKKSPSGVDWLEEVVSDDGEESDDTTIRATAASTSTAQNIKSILNNHGDSLTQRGATLSRQPIEGRPRRFLVWILTEPFTTVKAKAGSNNSLGTGFGTSSTGAVVGRAFGGSFSNVSAGRDQN